MDSIDNENDRETQEPLLGEDKRPSRHTTAVAPRVHWATEVINENDGGDHHATASSPQSTKRRTYNSVEDAPVHHDSPTEKQPTVKSKSAPAANQPSSRSTVLIISGFFLTGLMFFLSGMIVLAKEERREFRIVGGSFLGVGVIAVSLCFYVQQKNIRKLGRTVTHDLYFLYAALCDSTSSNHE